jgi:hypothetical protein
VIETGRKIIAWGRYGEEGTGRMQHAWVVDPDRVRNFRAGQAAWIHGNACTYVQIAPYRRSPFALPAGSRAAIAGPRPGVPLALGAGPGALVMPGPEIPLPDVAPGGGP